VCGFFILGAISLGAALLAASGGAGAAFFFFPRFRSRRSGATTEASASSPPSPSRLLRFFLLGVVALLGPADSRGGGAILLSLSLCDEAAGRSLLFVNLTVSGCFFPLSFFFFNSPKRDDFRCDKNKTQRSTTPSPPLAPFPRGLAFATPVVERKHPQLENIPHRGGVELSVDGFGGRRASGNLGCLI
jgi:hypothetical protein